MPLNTTRARDQLAKGNLRALFIEELGWDRHAATLEVQVDGSALTLNALAQKRGMVAYECHATAGQGLPDYPRRRKIEHRVARSTHEHLIVFTDAANDTQIWQWVKREPGKPAACREHTFHRSQPGDALLQKLEAIVFTLDEEDRLSLVDVTQRARAGFDVERVTKRFYDRFQKEHAAFLKFIAGITEAADREWYASVMLNRMMFVYFIQRKGFLDGNRDYLRDRLKRTRAQHGKDKFYSFYRYFLLRLFHEGLGGKARTRELENLLGCIPYLNGGLFDVHELEKSDRYGKTIQIPDQAFERIFNYFDQYQWHLDERPLRADNEINPDVLGYIFEKYINQKQMGAYYTKEDITEYISKNTVLSFLLDAVRSRCRVAFDNPKGPTVWDLLKHDPDRYIYSAVRYGTGEVLPTEIARGIDPPTQHLQVADGPVRTDQYRQGWNATAPVTHGLPSETWREVIARRERYEAIKAKLAAGEVHEINDLVTLNLDIRQFAQDVIENSEGPDLLRSFWNAIEKVSILDPTCGSGAFLFAALNILEPLYEACLDRMEAFVGDLARSGERHRPEKFSDFQKILNRVATHPNRRYFVFKSIILNNLFGVDIMEESVEICKLRLFLKLAAQINPDSTRTNLGVEPLPDIDFNIRPGNTLVGYSTLDAVKRAVSSKFDFDKAAEKIAVKAADLQQAFDAFRSRQIDGDGSVPAQDKLALHTRLKALDDELNRHLAGEYGVEASKKDSFFKWIRSHQPFHWFVEYYGIMSGGGFDVIIGNPPYVQRNKISDYTIRGYRTEGCPDIYAACVERSLTLLADGSRFGMILPISSQFSDEFASLRAVCTSLLSSAWVSAFSRNPAALFSAGLGVRNSIVLGHVHRESGSQIRTTRLNRWIEDGRPFLFQSLEYNALSPELLRFGWPRVDSARIALLFRELISRGWQLFDAPRGASQLRFKTTALYYISAFSIDPPSHDDRGRPIAHTKVGQLLFRDDDVRDIALALVLGKIALIWWAGTGDDFDVTAKGLAATPLSPTDLPASVRSALRTMGRELQVRMRKNVIYTKYAGKMMGNYDIKYVRDVTDRADQAVLGVVGLAAYRDDLELAYARFMKVTGERPGTTRRAIDEDSLDGDEM
jgi:hypothetical protein